MIRPSEKLKRLKKRRSAWMVLRVLGSCPASRRLSTLDVFLEVGFPRAFGGSNSGLATFLCSGSLAWRSLPLYPYSQSSKASSYVSLNFNSEYLCARLTLTSLLYSSHPSWCHGPSQPALAGLAVALVSHSCCAHEPRTIPRRLREAGGFLKGGLTYQR